jgi:hypothetical protein
LCAFPVTSCGLRPSGQRVVRTTRRCGAVVEHEHQIPRQIAQRARIDAERGEVERAKQLGHAGADAFRGDGLDPQQPHIVRRLRIHGARDEPALVAHVEARVAMETCTQHGERVGVILGGAKRKRRISCDHARSRRNGTDPSQGSG